MVSIHPLVIHSLRADVWLAEDDRGDLVLHSPTLPDPMPVRNLSPPQKAGLRALEGEGASEEEIESVLAGGDENRLMMPWFYFVLNRLSALGLAQTTLIGDGVRLATAQPLSRFHEANGAVPPPDEGFVLSRFAYVRRAEPHLVLESPGATVQIVLHDWRAVALVAALHKTSKTATFGADFEIATQETARAFLTFLFGYRFLEAAECAPAADPEQQALDQWEFHDLLFHSRSRMGRHRNPWGATYAWEGRHSPLPAVKTMTGTPIVLHRPDLSALKESDRTLTSVLEDRRSLRNPGEAPVHVEQLGEFLFRTARVRGRLRTEHEEVSSRPYPGGGADYELEIYPLIHRCAGLDAGLYYYDPLQHALYPVAAPSPKTAGLLRDACQKARSLANPDVLLCITSRFQRLTYKYQSIAYSVMLKDLGVLYQTLYLVATAMSLSPCALGGGDADLFAEASDLSYFVEPSVGEFMLNGAPG